MAHSSSDQFTQEEWNLVIRSINPRRVEPGYRERRAHSSSDQLTQEEWNLVIEILRKESQEDFIEFHNVFNITNEKEKTHCEIQYPLLCDELGKHLEKHGYHNRQPHVCKIKKSKWASYMLGSFKYYYTKGLSESQVREIIKQIKEFIDTNHQKYKLPIKKVFDGQDCQQEDGPSKILEKFCPDSRRNPDVNEICKISTPFKLKHVLGADEELFNDYPDLSKKLFYLGEKTMKMLIESPKKFERDSASLTQRFDSIVITEKNGVKHVSYVKGTKVEVVVGILPDNTINHFEGPKHKGKINTFFLPPQNEIQQSSSENEEPSPVMTMTAGMAPKNLEESMEEEGLAVRGEHKEPAEYTHLLNSQLVTQRHYFEDKMELMEKQCFKIRQEVEVTNKRTLSKYQQLEKEFNQAHKEKVAADKKCAQVQAKNTELQAELREEKVINKCLQSNLSELQVKGEKKEKILEQKNQEIADLQEKLRDIMFHMDARQKIAASTELSQAEIQESKIVMSPLGGASGGGGRKARKKGR